MPNFPTTAASIRKELAAISARIVGDFDGDNRMFTVASTVRRLDEVISRMEERGTKRPSEPVDNGVQTELTDKEKEAGNVPADERVGETPQEKLDNVTRPSKTGRKQRADHPSHPRGPRNG